MLLYVHICVGCHPVLVYVHVCVGCHPVLVCVLVCVGCRHVNKAVACPGRRPLLWNLCWEFQPSYCRAACAVLLQARSPVTALPFLCVAQGCAGPYANYACCDAPRNFLGFPGRNGLPGYTALDVCLAPTYALCGAPRVV